MILSCQNTVLEHESNSITLHAFKARGCVRGLEAAVVVADAMELGLDRCRDPLRSTCDAVAVRKRACLLSPVEHCFANDVPKLPLFLPFHWGRRSCRRPPCGPCRAASIGLRFWHLQLASGISLWELPTTTRIVEPHLEILLQPLRASCLCDQPHEARRREG